MLNQARYTWYPLIDPEEESSSVVPKDFIVAARFSGFGLEDVTLEKITRAGSSVYVDFQFNNETSHRLEASAITGFRSYRVAEGDYDGYVTLYNADVSGILQVYMGILPALITDYSDSFVTGLRAVGTGSISGWKGTVLDQIFEYSDSVKLVPGYNCCIEYNSITNTIYISRSKGMGEGVISSPCKAPDEKSIVRVNGKMLETTDLKIQGANGLNVTETAGGVSIYLDSEAVKGV